MSNIPDIMICGAGMVGVAVAYHLTRRGAGNVVLLDEREALSLTSAAGTEAYRNWWPGPDDTMLRFMQRSVTLLETLAWESDQVFRMNQRGYVYLTADSHQIPAMRQQAETVCGFGAGPLRIHPTDTPYIPSDPDGINLLQQGADLIDDPVFIKSLYPFITSDVVAMLHARRCGWLDARALGRWMLTRFLDHGGVLLRDRLSAVSRRNNRLQSVTLRSGTRLSPGRLILSPGPLLGDAGATLGLNMPVFNELHAKVTLEDVHHVVPPEAPMLIWNDPVYLCPGTDRPAGMFPAGVHLRPRIREGRHTLLGIWTYDVSRQKPVFPPRFDHNYANIVLRGLTAMIPGLRVYSGSAAFVDGGYYCKTPDNRPLIGPLPVEDVFVAGALSGYGVMGAQATAELMAAHILGDTLPDYAGAFAFDRFENPEYRAKIAGWDATTGQL